MNTLTHSSTISPFVDDFSLLARLLQMSTKMQWVLEPIHMHSSLECDTCRRARLGFALGSLWVRFRVLFNARLGNDFVLMATRKHSKGRSNNNCFSV